MKKTNLTGPRGRLLRGALLAALCAAPLLIIADTVYVTRGDAALKAGPSYSDSTLTQLQLGDALTVLEPGSPKMKVQTADGQVGYILKLNTSTSKPSTGGSDGVVLADSTGPGEASSASSIRGLDPGAAEYAVAAQLPAKALQDVKDMENASTAITDADVQAFAQAGGVTPQ